MSLLKFLENRWAFVIIFSALGLLFAYSGFLTVYLALVRCVFIKEICKRFSCYCFFLKYRHARSEQAANGEFVNRLCGDTWKTPPIGLTHDDMLNVCQPLPDRFTIDKFLLFATDCWPSKEAKDVFDHYKVRRNTSSVLVFIVVLVI